MQLPNYLIIQSLMNNPSLPSLTVVWCVKMNILFDLHVQDEEIIPYCISTDKFCCFVLALTRMGENYLGFFSRIKWILKHIFENCKVLLTKTTCTQMWDGTFISFLRNFSKLQD